MFFNFFSLALNIIIIAAFGVCIYWLIWGRKEGYSFLEYFATLYPFGVLLSSCLVLLALVLKGL